MFLPFQNNSQNQSKNNDNTEKNEKKNDEQNEAKNEEKNDDAKDVVENEIEKENENKKDEAQDDVITLKKADFENLLKRLEKINEIEKALQKEQAEKKALKFEALKQKYNIDNDMCEILGINSDTSEHEIVKKLEKFNKVLEKIATEKDAFLRTPETKSDVNTQIQELLKKGKVTEAINLQMRNAFKLF